MRVVTELLQCKFWDSIKFIVTQLMKIVAHFTCFSQIVCEKMFFLISTHALSADFLRLSAGKNFETLAQ